MYIHNSIFSWKKRKHIPPTYTYITMILGDLKKVGITENDTVIIAEDKGRSWRKELDKTYKQTRKKKREKHEDIPWKKHFNSFNRLMELFEECTSFHVVGIWGLEADDIISYTVRYFKDRECLILSIDKDFEQLFYFPNVRIFSPRSKHYKKPLTNPLSSLSKKIEKEASDDLIAPILTKEDYDIRKKIVSLIELPEEIEKKIEEKIQILPEKELVLKNIPYHKLRNRWEKLYDGSKKIDYEKDIKRGGKKNVRRKKKKSSKRSE